MLGKVERSNKNGVFDVLDLLFNVVGVLQNTSFSLFEFVDTFKTVFNVLGNAQTKPVVVILTLVHQTVKLRYLLFKQLLFDWS